MLNLLHLSDLHFGYDQDDTARAQRDQALDLLVRELDRLRGKWPLHILVISGDLTWQGKPAGYTKLGEWLTEKLFPATGLAAANCVICPGNHDIDHDAAFSLLDGTVGAERADQLLRPERLAAGFARPFEAFVKFAESFGIPAPMLGEKPNHLAGVLELHGIRFVCLNSAWFCRDTKTDEGRLWLGLPQLQSMGLMNPKDYDSAPITVAVLHHPPKWLALDECRAPGNRRNTYAFLAESSHAILSGHIHGAIERPDRCSAAAWLFLGGATYKDQAYRNNFSLFRIDPRKREITRHSWEFDPRKARWAGKDPDTYSLYAEKTRPGTANTEEYFAWLRRETQSINLYQLKVGPGEIPPPAIDSLYIKLMTAAPAQKGEAMERSQPVPLEEALQNPRLVIEGKPGGGKTTFVRWIAWNLCRRDGPPPSFPVRGFPLWVRISQLDQHIVKTLEGRQPGDPAHQAEARWIAHFLAAQGWELDEAFFREKLEAKDTVLLLDGLDEAANQPRREKIVEMIGLAAGQYGCHMVVTTRPGAHEGRATLAGFEKSSIDDLDDPRIDGFLLQWCRWLKRGDEAAAQGYYTELRPAVAVPSIHILARNPLMLTALAVLHLRRKRLPEQRAELYEQILDWLADQAVERHPEHSKGDLLGRFGSLALGLQEWEGGQKLQIGIDDAAALLTPANQRIELMRGFLEQAQIDSGIVTRRGGEIAFWHQSFQEYLAARTLAGLPDTDLETSARKLLYSPEGREVLPLLAGGMAGPARKRLDNLFASLTRDAVAQERLDRKAHAVGVLGNMLRDLIPVKYELSGPAKEQFGQLRQTVMAIFKKGKTKDIGLKTRVDAAEALDQASQSRLRTPGDPDYWVEIPGDTFTIGDPKAFQSLPVRSVTVPTFRIGMFPVTVWEYSKFLDETEATPPRSWDEQALHPSRPVVWVTWHEAQRYCEWARSKLPTEEQWEFAARGAKGRVYPWGPEEQEPDEHRANFKGSAGELTPVGMFPDGDTLEGVADMAGNVWEWTRSDYDKDAKVLRGGSFGYGARGLRAAFRVRVVPGLSYDSLGFRCVRE
jgi:formylglycine-generating enzyme required for sulfatase activity